MDTRFLRQQDAVNMKRLTQLRITVIGAGAIGSTTCVFLGKMGACGLRVWDADHVQSHNWSNQMFRDEDIGRLEETAVFHALERRKQDLFYFSQKSGEVDFLVCRGLSVQEMIQVTHSDLSEENAKARELAPLTAADHFPGSLRTLITYDWPDAEIPQPTKNLRLWEWLLDSA